MASENQSNPLQRHYATDENLRTRQEIHERYTIPDKSFVEWVLERYAWQGSEYVLDVGCGPGTYYDWLRRINDDVTYMGIDLMPSMMNKHQAQNYLSAANALRLPFADATFDVVMANHMLYHVADIEAAIVEMRRVLKPNGVLMTATNSMQTMPEFQVLMRRAIVLLTRNGAAQVRAPEMPSDAFALENGVRLLSKYFFAVVRHDLTSSLVFPEVEPAMAYLESTRDLREASLPDDVIWDDVMMIMRQQISQLIKHLGELVIKKQSGVLQASNGGGFIGEFRSLHKTNHG